MAKMIFALTLALCCLYGVQAFQRPVQTCQQLADMIEVGLRVESGVSMSEDDPAGEKGEVTGRNSDSNWQVNWYDGNAGSYRMGTEKKYDLFPAGLGCRPEASQGDLEPNDICCTAECTHIIISGSTTEQTDMMTHYTLTHQIHEGRPVYASDFGDYYLYYKGSDSSWCVGPIVGGTHYNMYVYDSAMSPDRIQGTWKLSTAGRAFTSFPDVKASCAECREITISGSVHFQESRMTTYSLTSQIFNSRPVYRSDTRADYLYYYAPYEEWMVGPTVGSNVRGLTTVDIHLYPEQIEAVWKLWDGSLFVPFPRVEARCTDVDDCASSPCQHGAPCTDLHNSYSCDCYSGWVGHNCESDKNECATVSCNSGHVCVNHPGYYECVPHGLQRLFSGHSDRSICGPDSCAEGWTCEGRKRGYACLPSQ